MNQNSLFWSFNASYSFLAVSNSPAL